MNYKGEIEKELYPSALAVMLAVAFALMLSYMFGIGNHEITALLASLFAVILVYAGRRNKGRFLAALVAASCLTAAAAVIFRKSLLLLFKAYLEWWTGLKSDKPAEKEGFELISVFLAAFLISAVLYFLMQYYAVRLGTALLLLSALVVLGFADFMTYGLGTVLTLAYVFLVLLEFVLRLVYPSEQEKFRPALTYLVPVALIFVLLLSGLPFSEKPMKWTIFRRAWSEVQKIAEEITLKIKLLGMDKGENSEQFEVSFVGYTDNGQIAGDIQQEDQVAMVLNMLGRPKTAFYLGGNSKDTYVGDGWVQAGTDADLEFEQEWDTTEWVYAMWREGLLNYDPPIMKIQKFNVIYKDILTKSLFTPLKLISLTAEHVERDGTAGRNGIHFSKYCSSGEQYELRFLELNLEEEKLQDFVRSQEKFRYDGTMMVSEIGLEEALRNNGIYLTLPYEVGKGLEKRAGQIRSQYLVLPDDLPQRVKELAAAITDGYSSDYDKLKALEDYLSGLSYTLSPGSLPDGRDAVDYFLFDQRKGYCSHFASAMAVMSRCVGIPSRYVQGFMADTSGRLVYEVKSQNAHAWVECYLEGVGWLPFEPTAGYQETFYEPWKAPEASSENKPAKPADNSSYVLEELMQKELEAELAAKTSAREKNDLYGYIFLFCLLAFMLLIIGYAASLGLSEKRFRLRYRRADAEGKLEYEARLLMLIWNKMGFHISQGETFLCYSGRVASGLPEQDKEIRSFADSYMKNRYGGQEVREEEVAVIRLLREKMQELYKKECSKLHYLADTTAMLRKAGAINRR